jgi:phage shock protein A
MGIFSRFKDIINSNLNTMLEKAEDPEKLIKLMIQEMEDTLVELKASCAGAMANESKVHREAQAAKERGHRWEQKAKMAIEKGREDLAREALLEKRAAAQENEHRTAELEHFRELINQYKADITQLEEKLDAAKNKHRILVQRHIHASQRKSAQTRIRRSETSDAFVRFEQFETRIDRMDAEADLVNLKGEKLEDAFDKMETDDEIEKELASLKNSMNTQNTPSS